MPRNSLFSPVQFTLETRLNQYPVVGAMSCRNGRKIWLLNTCGPTAVVILLFLSENDRLSVGTSVVNNSLATPGESMFFYSSDRGAQVLVYGIVFALRRTNGSIQSIIKCMGQNVVSAEI